jgi:hypothetical protein
METNSRNISEIIKSYLKSLIVVTVSIGTNSFQGAMVVTIEL